jgi:hypothetical protein
MIVGVIIKLDDSAQGVGDRIQEVVIAAERGIAEAEVIAIAISDPAAARPAGRLPRVLEGGAVGGAY